MVYLTVCSCHVMYAFQSESTLFSGLKFKELLAGSRHDLDFGPASSKKFLDIQAVIEYGFTLKRVRDMTRTYSQVMFFLV